MELAEWLYVIGTILILPAIIFAFWAQFRVGRSFDEFSKIASTKGLSASSIARKLLDQNGCGDVSIVQTHGHLTDHFDPKKKVIALSDEVYASNSLSAIGIACHEVGHAIQQQTHYLPLVLRHFVIKSTNVVNKLLLPLIIIGMIGMLFTSGMVIMGMSGEEFMFYFILALCIVYALSFLVNVVTLPTEFDASHRAKKLLREGNFLYGEEEHHAVADVLRSASLTYVASLVISTAYLLRFLGILMSLRRN
jgi:Zn-dependent membrane protease YugP